MKSKLAIFAAVFIAVGSVSGIALGQFATRAGSPGAAQAESASKPSDSFGADITSPVATATQTLQPDHIPICRKGCGPTLSERKEANYYGDASSRQLDAIYRDDADYNSDDSEMTGTQYAPDVQAGDDAPSGTSSP